MSKGKRQRQRERAKQKAQEAAERRLIVEKEEMAKDHAESATQTASNPLPAKKTRWWVRFWNYLCEKSSFTDWCIAAFTCVLMTVAVYQYKVMDGQLQALIAQLDVMQKDQRAWMEIDPANENDFFKTAQTGDPLRQLAKIKNIGKTPARMIVVKAMSELLPATEEPHFNCIEGQHVCNTNRISMGILFPNGETTIDTARLSDDGEEDRVTDTELADLRSGKTYLATFGEVGYFDIHGHPHWTRFCFWEGAKHHIFHSEACTRYSNVDQDTVLMS